MYVFGSLFLLLSILAMSSIIGSTDMEVLFKSNFDYTTQIFLFCGIFFAIAVKTPVYGLNSWLLKAHTEAPLSGSIILAAIVLKLGLYGIIRLILPIIPQASLDLTCIVYIIGVITVIYSSISTLRTLDIKEMIAYSSVAHAAIYLMGVFSNTVAGIEGAIVLGLGHGFVSSGLFICAGGILYDRTGTRLIAYYKGMTQMMPLFSILFFILCLGNCGTPLTLNFIGEFLSLYGTFERLPVLGALATSSVIFSAAYSIYLFNRVAFGGSFSLYFKNSFIDLSKREFFVLFTLVFFTVLLGITPNFILDGLHYNISSLIYSVDYNSYASNGTIPTGIRYYSTRPKPSNNGELVEDEKSLNLNLPIYYSDRLPRSRPIVNENKRFYSTSRFEKIKFMGGLRKKINCKLNKEFFITIVMIISVGLLFAFPLKYLCKLCGAPYYVSLVLSGLIAYVNTKLSQVLKNKNKNTS